jgi:hypothetical protein
MRKIYFPVAHPPVEARVGSLIELTSANTPYAGEKGGEPGSPDPGEFPGSAGWLTGTIGRSPDGLGSNMTPYGRWMIFQLPPREPAATNAD